MKVGRRKRLMSSGKHNSLHLKNFSPDIPAPEFAQFPSSPGSIQPFGSDKGETLPPTDTR